ncbi:MAG: RnfABCDGE type electron transport complex subunit G [Candidatus Omnitrophota bacterium]
MKNAVRMILVLTVTGLISSLSLALIYRQVEPRVMDQQTKATREAVLAVVPAAVKFTEKKVEAETTYYEVFGNDGKILGYGLPGSGVGYGGVILVMVGVTPDLEKATGLKVLENVETPGLGGKITEKEFQDKFSNLILEPGVSLVKGKKSKANEVEAITGATISSRAIVKIVNDTITKFKPIILNK